MAKFIPKIVQPILNYVPSEDIENATSIASKAIRAKILLDREIRGFEKADIKPRDGYTREGSRGGNNPKAHREGKDGNKPNEGYVSEQPNRLQTTPSLRNALSIVDIDYQDSDYSERGYNYVDLPFVPKELNYNPSSDFIGIATFGRNNPYYQFTGSEDTLTFEIDWFSKQENREDVIFNCRWLEALSKGNSYLDTPHRVLLVWGEGNKLFNDSLWLVTSAPYKLSNFVRGYKDVNGNVQSVGMLPQQAYQSIVLKRITSDNLTSGQIIGNLRRNA